MAPDNPSRRESNPASPRFVDGYFPLQPVPPMALDNDGVLALIQQLEADRKAYLSTFEKIHDTLSQALHSQPKGPESRSPVPARPTVSFPTSLPFPGPDQPLASPKTPPSTSSHQSAPSSRILDHPHYAQQPKESIFTGESSDTEDDESFFAQDTLPPRDFTEDDLIEHLKTHPWDIYSKYILRDLLRNLNLLSNGIFLKDRHHQTDANHQHADIYHVGTDGAPLRFSRGDSDEGPLAAWEALKSTNSDKSRKQAVGRIIIVREPASSLFAALHLTMKEYFDMDSIYRILIDDYTPTKAITKGYLKKDHRRQRSVVFVFKYHTIVGEGRAPLSWQNHDDVLEPKDDHVPLSTCSAVVALSLAGRPSYTLRRNSRKTKSILGHVYDPFAAWHVLSIQCFPDWNSSVDAHETNHHYCNGPDAFLAAVLSEYRDAVKRFKEVHKSIQNVATPPNKSIFDSDLRDELLFENDKYTYSRRYFWASQTLGLMSNEIKAMISAYNETFTDEFWSGEHKTLFPGTKDQSSRYSNWRRKLLYTRKQFEKEVGQLEDVLEIFRQQQKEVRGLREWLFSGTSVLESREAVSMAKITVEQGYNIRLLTLVTLFYLPLTFVTSIYGMTNMPPEDSFLPFALTAVGICLPTYLLILVVNNPDKVKTILANTGLFFAKLTSIPAPKRSKKLKEKILERKHPQPEEKRPTIRKAATHASLEARLSLDLHHEPSLRGSHGFIQATRRMSQTIGNHLPGAAGRRSSPAAIQHSTKLPTCSEEEMGEMARQRQRSSTVKFEEPLYNPTKWRTAEWQGEESYQNGTAATRWRTEESEGSTLRGLSESALNIEMISPTQSPSVINETGSATPSPMTVVREEERRERSLGPNEPDTRSRSRFGRLGSHFSGLQAPGRASGSGSKIPREEV